MRNITLAFFIILLFCVQQVTGQAVCSQELKRAEFKYEEGDLLAIPEMLENCLKNGFTHQEQIQAYRLLTLTYLYMDDSLNADASLLNLLRLQKDYKVNPVIDPAELVYLYKTFRTKPLFYINTQIGANFTFVNLVNRFGIENTDSSYSENPYSSKISPQISASIDIPVKNNFQVSIGLKTSIRRFEYKNFPFNSPHPFQEVKLKESQFWIDLPMSVKYVTERGKYMPYLYVGIAPQVIISASADVTTMPTGKLDNPQNPVTGPNIKLTSEGLRNRFNWSGMIGVGVRYKIGVNYIGAEISGLYGFTNLANEKNRYNNSLVFDYHYVDNDFLLNSLAINFTYLQSIYKPKKLIR